MTTNRDDHINEAFFWIACAIIIAFVAKLAGAW